MARSKSSAGWLKEHHADQFVKRSKEDGYRSRASYKLLELDRQDKLLKPGMTIVDLGAAPGGWSQVATAKLDGRGRVIACDLLEMDALPDVEFVKGDFTDEATYQELLDLLDEGKADLVISDMAPNMSGVKSADMIRAMYLVELAADFASSVLREDGVFVAKIFHGSGFDQLLKGLRLVFKSVKIRKPDASRARSREAYIVASGFRG